MHVLFNVYLLYLFCHLFTLLYDSKMTVMVNIAYPKNIWKKKFPLVSLPAAFEFNWHMTKSFLPDKLGLVHYLIVYKYSDCSQKINTQ